MARKQLKQMVTRARFERATGGDTRALRAYHLGTRRLLIVGDSLASFGDILKGPVYA